MATTASMLACEKCPLDGLQFINTRILSAATQSVRSRKRLVRNMPTKLQKKKAFRLKESGVSNRMIAALTKVNRETINKWFNPEYALACKEKDRKRYREHPTRREEMKQKSRKWQTENKHGKVTYFVRSFRYVKIGSTTNLKVRLHHLVGQLATPVEFLGICDIPELELHDKFGSLRHHGEWFKLTPKLKRFIRDNCAKT